jgi:hypothetical protein
VTSRRQNPQTVVNGRRNLKKLAACRNPPRIASGYAVASQINGSSIIHRARARGAELRKSVHRPYLRELTTIEDVAERIARFHSRAEEVDGIALQVLENTANAGDAMLMHPLLLHAPPTTYLGRLPRFLLNKDIYR